jgi:hypothetical protein
MDYQRERELELSMLQFRERAMISDLHQKSTRYWTIQALVWAVALSFSSSLHAYVYITLFISFALGLSGLIAAYEWHQRMSWKRSQRPYYLR